jgi:transcriptional regulator with XRE-family HTH domain
MQPPINAAMAASTGIVPLMRTLGTRLRAARQAMKLTQAELGDRIGVTPQFVSQVEADKKEPGREVLVALHSQIGISLDYLLFGASTPLSEHGANVTVSSHSRRGVAVPLVSARDAMDPYADTSNSERLAVFFSVGPRACAIMIRDDANAGELARGETAVFDPDAASPPGSIVLARYKKSKPVIGRLRYETTAAGTVTIVQPINSAWPAARSDLGRLDVISTLVVSQRLHKN